MSRFVELLRSRSAPRFAVLALMSVGFSGCSADMSTRLSQNYSNPFASEPQATGSVPTPAVERRELPQYARPQSQTQYQQQYQSQPLAPPAVAAPHSYPVASNGVSGGGRGLSSYSPPPARPQLETTGTVAPRSVAAAHPPAASGTTIIVGTSDTLDIISKRYNVSSAAILQANGYKGPRALSPGQQLIIPHQTASVAAPALAAAPAVAPPVSRAVAAASERSRRQSRRYPDEHRAPQPRPGGGVGAGQQSRHLGQAQPRHEADGARCEISRCCSRRSAGCRSARSAGCCSSGCRARHQDGRSDSAAAKRTLAQATTNVTEEKPVVAEAPAVKPSETTGGLPTFRWPVRGKVITSYGAKTNGKSNDGINLAVPEGTPVKAAEDGVVAYSGNELKGYGNLVLVRHSNGYVTAYAHASELMVKRGDTIKRGQIIAKSGQSGEVGSPQLHFEIRKGSSPVDPLQFLNGA